MSSHFSSISEINFIFITSLIKYQFISFSPYLMRLTTGGKLLEQLSVLYIISFICSVYQITLMKSLPFSVNSYTICLSLTLLSIKPNFLRSLR